MNVSRPRQTRIETQANINNLPPQPFVRKFALNIIEMAPAFIIGTICSQYGKDFDGYGTGISLGIGALAGAATSAAIKSCILYKRLQTNSEQEQASSVFSITFLESWLPAVIGSLSAFATGYTAFEVGSSSEEVFSAQRMLNGSDVLVNGSDTPLDTKTQLKVTSSVIATVMLVNFGTIQLVKGIARSIFSSLTNVGRLPNELKFTAKQLKSDVVNSVLGDTIAILALTCSFLDPAQAAATILIEGAVLTVTALSKTAIEHDDERRDDQITPLQDVVVEANDANEEDEENSQIPLLTRQGSLQHARVELFPTMLSRAKTFPL